MSTRKIPAPIDEGDQSDSLLNESETIPSDEMKKMNLSNGVKVNGVNHHHHHHHHTSNEKTNGNGLTNGTTNGHYQYHSRHQLTDDDELDLPPQKSSSPLAKTTNGQINGSHRVNKVPLTLYFN